MLIKNYGLFWKAEDVFWGKPGNSGSLLGVRAKAHTSDPVDFREQTGIYVLYADYKIVYIGQAGYGYKKLFDRLKNHLSDDLSGRWNQFSWFGLKRALKNQSLAADKEGHYALTDIVLNHVEAILIHASEPPLNRQGGKWGVGVEKYLQYRDEANLGKTTGQLIKEIHGNLFNKK